LPRDYLKRQGLDPEKLQRQLEETTTRWAEAKREPVLDLLTADDVVHAVVLGDPGAGKSMLARYLLLSLLDDRAAAAAPAWREKLKGRLPLLIELRRYIAREAEGKCEDGFLDYLDYLGREQGFGLTGLQVQDLLRNEPALVIFDGLDEVFDPEVRERIAREITGFALDYAPSRIVVTSRIAGFDARPFEEAGFTISTLDDLDEKQIETFSRGWFRLAFASRPEEAVERHKHVIETLQNRPALRALAGNPLLLTIIAIIARHGELPRSRAGLYEHALNVLCHNWDFRRHLDLPPDSPLRDLELDHKLALLRRIAWRMQEGEGLRANAIEENDLRREIEAYFASEWRYDTAKQRRCAREMIDVLQRRNYILCPQGPAIFGFIHRTFLEYLCAAQIRWRFEKDHDLTIEQIRDCYILPHVEDDSWHEIIRLVTALLQFIEATCILEALVSTTDTVLSGVGMTPGLRMFGRA
jgi:predicted NACHT family NTPase